MSALSTSVVNKSSKKLAPKVPAQRRRPQAPAPTPPLSVAESRQSVSDNEHGEPASKRQRLGSVHDAPERNATSTQQPRIPTPPPTQQTSAQSITATPSGPAPASTSNAQETSSGRAPSVVSDASNRSRRGATRSTDGALLAQSATPATILSSGSNNRNRRQSNSQSHDPQNAQSGQVHAPAPRRSPAASNSRNSVSTRASSQARATQEQPQAGENQIVERTTPPNQESNAAEPIKNTTRPARGRAGKGKQAQRDSDNVAEISARDEHSLTSDAQDPSQGKGKTRSKATKKMNAKEVAVTPPEATSPASRRGRGRRAQPGATGSADGPAADGPASDHQHEVQANNGAGLVDQQASSGVTDADAPRTRSSRGRKTARRSTAEAVLPSVPPDAGTQSANQQAEGPTEPEDEEGQSSKNAKPRKRRERAATPDDAENHEIDAATVTMTALTRDTRQGKKSKVEAAMQEINWADVARKRREAEDRAYEHGELERSEQEVNARLDRAGEQSVASSAPRTKIVNGQIVIDTASLVVDRHAAAAADSANQPIEELEETDLTSHVTSHSWVHDSRRDPEERRLMKMKSDPWSKQQTNEFYKALAMFGTDFFIISKMFPGKTRRQIKLKFVREERSDPARINAAVLGEHTTPMDIGAYSEATGREQGYYKDPRQLQAELRDEEDRQKRELEQQREEQEQAQRDKQRRAAEKSAAAQRERAARRAASASKRKGRGAGAAPEPGPGAEGVEVAVEPAPEG